MVCLIIDFEQINCAFGFCSYNCVGDNPCATGLSTTLGRYSHSDFADSGRKFITLKGIRFQ